MDSTPSTVRSSEPRKKPRRSPALREASFKDYEQIAALQARNGLGERGGYEEWSHLWLGNPVYRGLHGEWSIGWVLEDDQSRIVGYMANIPLLYEFEGREILTASGRGWAAEPEYRSASLLLLDCVINQPRVDLYLNNTVGVTSTPAVTAFQCPHVPVGVWDQSVFWITHYQGAVESLLWQKNYRQAKLLSYPLSAAICLKERLTRKGLSAGDVEVETCTTFDGRFDDFWADLKGRSPHVLLAVRTREMLEWHFKYALHTRQVWIGTVVDGGRMVAYAVFDRRDRADIGLRRMRLVDFVSLDGGAALLSPLLSWALKRCRDEGMHVLEVVGRWLEKGELLDDVAPYRRKLPAWRYVYRANNPGLAESLSDPRAWAPSLFDGDASLMR